MKLLILSDKALVKTKSGNDFAQYTEDQVLIEGVDKAIADYASNGWTIAIASNRIDVASGHKTLRQAIAEMRYCLSLANKDHTLIGYGLFCPDSGNDCWIVDQTSGKGQSLEEFDCFKILKGTFQKPNGGMLNFWNCQYKFCSKRLMIGVDDTDFGAAIQAKFGYMHSSMWLASYTAKSTQA